MVVSDLFPLGCYSEAFLAATKPQLPQTSLPPELVLLEANSSKSIPPEAFSTEVSR